MRQYDWVAWGWKILECFYYELENIWTCKIHFYDEDQTIRHFLSYDIFSRKFFLWRKIIKFIFVSQSWKFIYRKDKFNYEWSWVTDLSDKEKFTLRMWERVRMKFLIEFSLMNKNLRNIFAESLKINWIIQNSLTIWFNEEFNEILNWFIFSQLKFLTADSKNWVGNVKFQKIFEFPAQNNFNIFKFPMTVDKWLT